MLNFNFLCVSLLTIIGSMQSAHQSDIHHLTLKNNVVETSFEEPCDKCPHGGRCVPHVQCPAHLRDSFISHECHLGSHIGICCTTGQSHASEIDKKQRKSNEIDKRVLDIVHKNCKIKLKTLLDKEDSKLEKYGANITLKKNIPSFGHFQSLKLRNTEEITKLSHGALGNVLMAQELKERQAVDDDHFELGINNDLRAPFCPPKPSCPSDKIYSSLNGVCNNILNPSWGAENSPYTRMLPPNYKDGVWIVKENANPRAIVTTVLPDEDNPSSKYNILLSQFGQFIAHDTTNAVTLTIGEKGSGVTCCKADGKPLPPEMQAFGCYPIDIPPNDKFYGQFGQTCMNFIRTQLATPHDCALSYARQMNGVTHFLDLSHIYGDEAKCRTLREFNGGRLRMFNDFGRDLLPTSDEAEECLGGREGTVCFDSGDGHVNQMISLVSIHTLFNREHNRICAVLARLHPTWDDETLFNEARRINIGQYQHIVYNEWLPAVIGRETMDLFSLQPSLLYSNDYNPNIDPSITNEFAVAALRFGHSTVDGQLRISKDGRLSESISLPEVMFQPSRMRLKPFLDRSFNGAVLQPMQKVDPFITQALSQYMFHSGNPFGLDLASINIQRGRDHGLRSFNDYRRLIGQPPINTFDDFSRINDDKNYKLRCLELEPVKRSIAGSRLSAVYHSVEDIDLWIGGLLEKPVSDDAAVGVTFAHLLSEQFSRLRRGDRYHYQNPPNVNPTAFTVPQLLEIKKASLARIICDNTDGIELHSQPLNAFLRADIFGNQPIACDNLLIPRVELAVFA